jgi:hypothetical protein
MPGSAACLCRPDGGGQEAAGALPGQGAHLFGGVWHLCHRAHPADLDLPGLGHRAAGCGGRRLSAQLLGVAATSGRAVSAGVGDSAGRLGARLGGRTGGGFAVLELATPHQARWRHVLQPRCWGPWCRTCCCVACPAPRRCGTAPAGPGGGWRTSCSSPPRPWVRPAVAGPSSVPGLHQFPQARRCQRHLQMGRTCPQPVAGQRVGHGVHDCRRRTDGAQLTHALDPQRIVLAGVDWSMVLRNSGVMSARGAE